jgi:hypothetical protein
MSETATDAPKPTTTTDAPKPKADLLEMILFLEDEIGDIDTWERVLHSEGEPLYPKMERRRQILRQVMETLVLVREHQTKFVAIIKEARAAVAAATPKSTAPSSAKSTTESEELESTEP